MGQKVIIDFEAKYKEAAFDVEQLNKRIEGLEKQVKKTKETSSELGNQLDKVSGGAITKFKGLIGTLKGVVKSFFTIKSAIIATGIGALIIAVVSLTKAFTASEEGQNRFAKILKQLGVIAGNIGDIFYSLGDTIYNVFTGNFKEAGKAFDQLKSRIVNFGEETKREIELAGQLADKIADANKKERELLVERAKINVKINELKTKAAEVDKYTTEQRIGFLEAASKLENEITDKEIALAQTRLDVKRQENSLSESTKEDLDEEAQLEADLIKLQEQRLVRNKELLGVAAGLRKMEADKAAAERKAEEDKAKAEADKILAEETKRQEDIQKIRDEFRIKNEDADAKTELDKLSLQKSRDLLRLEQLNATEQQKIELLEYYANQEAAITEALTKEQKEKNDALALAKKEQVFSTLDAVIEAAGAETKVGRALFIARQAMLVREQIAEARATLQRITLRASEAGVDIAKGAAGTAKVGFPANVPLLLAFAAQAAGIITTVKSAVNAAKGSASGMGGGGGAAPATPQAPAFNVVGAAPENQLAQVLGEQEQKPIKAFVVSNEVTNAQALDRNIVKGASIG